MGPALALNVPLFDQGQARHAAAKARLRQALEQHAALAIEVRSLARQAWHREETAYARALFLRKVVIPRRQRILAHMQLQYNAMQAGVFQLLQVKRGEVEAGADYVGALHEYWAARAELELLLAGVALHGATSPPLSSHAVETKE